MNYDKMILEMLDRIVTLEERVATLEETNINKNIQTTVQEEYKSSKKYRYLSEFLKGINDFSIKLTFKEIENILQFNLASSARNHKEFWANSTSHPIALSWLSAGYKSVEINMEEEFVVLEKNIPKHIYPTKKILFCNLAYLTHYNTKYETTDPKNGGSYVSEYNDAFEKYNFEECEDGLYRGYVENNDRTLRIERIDPSAKKEKFVSNVLVVFCAKKDENKTVIIGWYDNATVYRDRDEDKLQYNNRRYNLCANIADSYLLPEEERVFEIPRANNNKDNIGFGQSNVWYAESKKSQKLVEKVIDYIKSYKNKN